MLRVDAGRSGRYCDGLSRRSFVQLGASGLALAGLQNAGIAGPTRAKDHAAILIWLDGGPSHLDLYDLKPEAPAEYRGIWRPIRTNVPGIEISEMFPRQAKVADKFSIVRSLYHNTGDHFAGGRRMLTAHDMGVSGANNVGKFPSIGSITAKYRGARRRGMPAYVSVPVASSIGLRPGYFGGNWMGAQYNPFQTGGEPNNKYFKVQNLSLAAGLTIDRLDDRRDLLGRLDRVSRLVDGRDEFSTRDKFDEDAFEFVSGAAARRAFDLSRENDKTRDRYGRHGWGQSTLLARRLVEAGSTFVTCHFGGWDHHWNLKTGMENYLPRVDNAVAALLEDLDERGMLDSTLVILCGEFSRTPRMNNGSGNGTPGRDHWGASMFCLLGGGGVQGGTIIGSTDAKGERPLDRPVRCDNIHATIYTALGIDPKLHLKDLSGRPTAILEDPTPIDELL